MTDITIQMKFFGAFRKFGEYVNFSVPAGSTIATVKNILQAKLDGETLVSNSVLANNDTILRDSDIVENDTELLVLPPVCGG